MPFFKGIQRSYTPAYEHRGTRIRSGEDCREQNAGGMAIATSSEQYN